MSTVLLNPDEVTATYQHGLLTIEASGHEDGVTNIRIISEQLLPIEPPSFRVEGLEAPSIGVFPYHVDASFPMDHDPHEIAVHTPVGTRIVAVRSLTSR